MIQASLSVFDLIVLGVMALSCLFAFFRGFVREILSLGAWLGAGIVTLYYFPMMAEKLQPHFKNTVVAAGFGTLGIYVTALVGFSIVNMVILKFVKTGADVGMLDNFLGLGFGAARGALMVSLGYFIVTLVLPEKEYPEWMKGSVTQPFAEKGAIWLVSIAPDYLRDISVLHKKAREGQDNGADRRDGGSYSRDAARQLDRLIQNSSPAR